MRRPQYTLAQRFLEGLCIAVMLGGFLYLIIEWRLFPDTVATHFNFEGVPDGWGGKGNLLVMPIVSFFLYLLLTGISFFPDIMNVPGKVTEANRATVDVLLTGMLVVTKFILVAFFAAVFIYTSLSLPLPTWLTPLLLALLAAEICYYIFKLYRATHS